MKVEEIAELVDICGKDIYRFCCQLTGNTIEAEDLFQDTFLKAVELSSRIERDRNPKSYLIGICIRLWKNRKRKYAWRKRITPLEHNQEEMDSDPLIHSEETPESSFLSKEEKDSVQNAVRQLDERMQITVYLYYTVEMSVEEISKTLKIPAGTVKSRLSKARNILRKKLEVDGYEA